MSAHDVTLGLDGRWSGTSGTACCPAHDDKTPSLSIGEGEGGRIIVKCHAGCSQDAVIDALQRRGLWLNHDKRNALSPCKNAGARASPRSDRPEPTNTSPPTQHRDLGPADATFDYFDAEGGLIMRVMRWEAHNERNNTGRKQIRPTHYDGRSWAWGDPAGPYPLYRLTDLYAHEDAPVLLVEGEKTADAARELVTDHIVSCWPHGAGSIDKVDIEPLRGRTIILWPDADEPGRKAMQVLAERLLPIARAVNIVPLPDDLPDGWDLADRLPANFDPDELIAKARDVRSIRLAALGIRCAVDLNAQEFREPKWAVRELIGEGLTVLAGKPKCGKSWAALEICASVAAGAPALHNLPTEPGDVLYLALEDTDRRLQGRLRAVLQTRPMPQRLSFVTEWRRLDDGGLDDLRLWLAANPEARLVMIDTLAKVRGKSDRNEGVYANDYAATTPLKIIADEFTVPIVFVHHTRKEKADDPIDSVSGTAGLTGAVDTIIVLEREPGTRYGTLHVKGRDVLERELALSFDEDTGRWSQLGMADDWRRTEARNQVLRVLVNAPEAMSPTDIASALGKKRGAVRTMLHRMVKSGEVVMIANGKYTAVTV